MDMKSFVFDEQDALRYGVDEAIMLWNIRYWIERNEANKRHFHDGRYWTYNSAEAFTKLFPFWSSGQIRRILKSLQTQGVLLTGNYNASAYDRTMWYALSDEYLGHFQKKENAYIENEKPIPDIKPDDKENILFPEENNIQKHRGTTENLCLFSNSQYYDFEKFKACFSGEEYQSIDIAYYYECVKDWSAAGGKKKRDWIATARNFMRGDEDKGKLKKIYSGLPQSAIDYLKMGSDE